MAPKRAKEKKSVGKKAGKGVAKKAGKDVDKKAKERIAKEFEKSVAQELAKSLAEKAEKSVESSGWKKPASRRNLDPSSPLLRSKCHFFKLPLELRFMVYSDVMKSGSLELLRSCQAIHKEAVEIAYRNGIHIVEEYAQSVKPRYIYGGRRESNQRKAISDKVQNVEIWTDLSNFLKPGEEYEATDYLGAHHPELKNPKISRRNCRIILWIRRSYLEEPHLEERLITMLRALRAFDNVFLSIAERGSFIDLPPWKPVSDVESWFKSLGNSLEPFFGPSTWHDNTKKDMRYWEFYPCQERQRG